MTTGCDLIYIPRFQKALENKTFVLRVFTHIEQSYCEKKKDRVSSYAVRFAAKEAFSKALGTGFFTKGIGPRDMWIENKKNGKPVLIVSAKLRKKLEEKKNWWMGYRFKPSSRLCDGYSGNVVEFGNPREHEVLINSFKKKLHTRHNPHFFHNR